MKEIIKKEATKIVRQGGSHCLNFRDLGRIVGIKSSSIHYYFPTKADLLAEIVKDYSKSFINELDRRTRNAKSLAKTLELVISFCEESQGEKLICLCGSLAVESSELDARVVGRVSDFFNSLEDWINKKIIFFDGEGKKSRPYLSKLIISAIEGALIVDRANMSSASMAAAKDWVRTI